VAAGLALCCAGSAFGEVTSAADNLRTGWYPDEPSLAPGSITEAAFGQAFKTPLQGAIMAQPLVANGTLFVVTEEDMAYGLDPVSGAVLWGKKFGTPVSYTEITNGAENCPDIKPHVGITSTPVIDTTTNVAYFVANNLEPAEVDKSSWWMHAVNLANGQEVSGFPVKLSGHKPDNGISGVTIEGDHWLQRPALLMLEGVIYAGFGSHCDFPGYAGVIAGVSTGGQVKTVWAATNNEGSIWQAGGGLISDGPKQLLFTTANSTPNGERDPAKGPGNKPPEGFLAQSVVRLEVQPEGHLKATDFFSPFNNKLLDEEDFDLGSSAPIALPSQYFGTPTDPNLLVQAGKKGEVYLLNRSNLGGMGQGPGGTDNVIEEKGLGEYGGVWDGFALWPGDGGYVYIPGVSKPATGQENFDYLRYFKYGVTGGIPNLSVAAKSTEEFGFGSGSPIVTSNGTNSGSAVLWITHCPYTEPHHCEEAEGTELWAYNAVPIEGKPKRLWRAPIGFGSKFSRPDANSGHIYVGNHEGDIFAFRATAPVIEKVSPTKGVVGGDTTVTITGKNLTGATAVKFGATAAASFTVDSATSIIAISPAEPAGKVDVVVTTAGGTSAVSSKDRFTFTPTVTGLRPNTGSHAGGTKVIVTGTGFVLGSTATAFKFGSTQATSVNCTATTTCTVVAPAHAVGTVDVKATVNKVSSPKATADQFTYN
jgi:hypothetical protein